MASLSTGALLLPTGCAVQPVDVDATRRACGLGPTGFYRSTGPTNLDLSEECVRALGEDVGFDWEGLGQEPRALLYTGGTDIPDTMVGGLFLLLASPMPSIAEELAEDDIPPVLERALRRVQEVNGFDDSLSASYLYYGLVAGRARRMQFVVDSERSAQFWYLPTRAIIVVNLDQVNLSVGRVPANLVHEVIHTWTSHVRCSPTSNRGVPDTPPVVAAKGSKICDQTTDGAWGAQLWYYYRMSRTAACLEPYHSAHCVWLDNETICRGKLLEVGDFTPCEVSRLVYEDSRHCHMTRHLGYIDPYLPPDCAPYSGTRSLAP